MTELETKISAVEAALAELAALARKQADELEAKQSEPVKQRSACPHCGSTVVLRVKSDGRVVCGRGHVYRP